MSLFAIGDTHLSFGTDKPMNVFEGWDGYEDRLREQWNAVVNDDDTVVVCGDVSWGMTLSEARADFEFLHALNGKKLILRGNHDYWWSTKRKVDSALAAWGLDTISILFNNSFVVDRCGIVGTRGWLEPSGDPHNKLILAREVGRLKLSVASLGDSEYDRLFAFLHYPPVYMNAFCDPIREVLQDAGVTRCYYGHIHGEGARFAVNKELDGIFYRLVSADSLDFRPYKIF